MHLLNINIDKTNNKKHIKSNLFGSNKFTFSKYSNIGKIIHLSVSLKQKDFKKLKTKLELFYDESEGIKLTTEDQEKYYIEDRKVVLDAAFNIYNMLLEVYTNQFNKLKHDRKKAINLNHKTYKYEGWFSEDDNEDEDKKIS